MKRRTERRNEMRMDLAGRNNRAVPAAPALVRDVSVRNVPLPFDPG